MDTHVFLWALTSDARLSSRALEMLGDPDVQFTLSVASVWEVLIKAQRGKLSFPSPAGPYLTDQIRRTSVSILPVALDHALQIDKLPLLHRDPFDRILVAQATVEGMALLTVDPVVAQYRGPVRIV